MLIFFKIFCKKKRRGEDFFLQKILKFELNDKKIINCIESTKLKNLREIERKIGFKEKPINSQFFFRKGLFNEWEEILSIEQIKVIENSFNKEMKELGYN